MYNLDNKICAFNVNEFHLMTILMPYIYEAVNEEKKVITFFEKDLQKIYEKVLNTNSLFWKNREKLDEIDWNKLEIDRLAEKFNNTKDYDIVIIAGKEEFIKRLNRLILNFHTNFTIVNCFEIDDFDKDLENLLSEYGKVLNTKGVTEIKKIDFV